MRFAGNCSSVQFVQTAFAQISWGIPLAAYQMIQCVIGTLAEGAASVPEAFEADAFLLARNSIQ